MYMPKVNINTYRRRKLYHEICHLIYDIMVWDDNDQTENSSTPIYRVQRFIGKNNTT